MDLPTQIYVEEEEDDVVEEESQEDIDKSEAATEAELEQNQQAVTSATAASAAKITSRDSREIAPRLMQKISAKKSVEEETVCVSSNVPPMGVKSDHPSELDKVLFCSVI